MLRVGASSMRTALFRPVIAPRLGGLRFSSNVAVEAEENIVPIRYAYYVPRVGVNGNSLPVYSDVRHRGSKWLTVIRKIDGDVPLLCRDMFESFGWGDPFDKKNKYSTLVERIVNSNGTRMIVLRGNLVNEVREWLEHRGF
ncbi:hypothetical protein MCUN1_000824 [Malassezia cuniculi]|uniref:Large ribosomal subunit protein mL49 n=1 Tax=Malassezia cuniculi TaxID=948313 RepID=A0AAF0EP44_9BASI|nr:hypothetical protein MCUN1_000824 [Malassezia cuniculi]